jgi:hypothetical protein
VQSTFDKYAWPHLHLIEQAAHMVPDGADPRDFQPVSATDNA